MKVQIEFPKPEFSYARFDRLIAQAREDGQDIVSIRLGSRPLGYREVDQLLDSEDLGDLYVGGPAHQRTAAVVIDLRDCTFVDPLGATVLHSLACAIALRVERVWLCLPRQLNVLSYCGVIGLTDQLRGQVALVGEAYRLSPSDGSEVLVPLKVFSKQDDVAELITTSTERLEQLLTRIRWPKAVAASAVAAIKEITMNVVEHAGTSGSFTLQAYKLNTHSPYIIVALSDAGFGIRATLERKHDALPQKDDRLLQELFEQRLTSRLAYDKGHGMSTLRGAVRDVRGSFRLRSGSGLYYENGPKRLGMQSVPIPGTHLRLSLNAPS